MASSHEISCIHKTERLNPYERIESIGGKNHDGTRWELLQQQAITGIESGKWSFYVAVGGQIVDVIVSVSRFGNKYLKTVSDGEQPNNLLSLNECPV